MTHNTPEEKSPATTADITKSSWLEDPLPAAVHFRHGWSLTVAFLLAIGVITGQIIMLDILPSRLLWDQGRKCYWPAIVVWLVKNMQIAGCYRADFNRHGRAYS